jgi:3-isopropylmalate dehydrogenase
MSQSLLVLPGDGIGVEVTEQAMRIVAWFQRHRGLDLEIEERLFGGACYDVHGVFVEDQTVEKAHRATAVLCGAVGGPKWDSLELEGKPEEKDGLSRLRKELDLYANLRPARPFDALKKKSPLKPEVLDGVDLIVLRELTSGLYFGQPRGIESLADGSERGVDTQVYTTAEIERMAHQAFQLAGARRGIVHSVEKSNVMESGVLWRRVFTRVHEQDYADLTLHHMLADNCALQLVQRPAQFDILAADNIFGDLLSDLVGAIPGSLGMLPSASLGPARTDGSRPALYEPVHGTAPDIAGQGIANPLAAILSAAMMLRLTFDRPDDADLVESAVEAALNAGARTADIAMAGEATVGTVAIGDAVLGEMDRLAR